MSKFTEYLEAVNKPITKESKEELIKKLVEKNINKILDNEENHTLDFHIRPDLNKDLWVQEYEGYSMLIKNKNYYVEIINQFNVLSKNSPISDPDWVVKLKWSIDKNKVAQYINKKYNTPEKLKDAEYDDNLRGKKLFKLGLKLDSIEVKKRK